MPFGLKQDEFGNYYRLTPQETWNHRIGYNGKPETCLRRKPVANPEGTFSFKLSHTWIGHYLDLGHPTPLRCSAPACGVCGRVYIDPIALEAA